jgi:V/A-type H+-transporting ATPase subunit D
MPVVEKEGNPLSFQARLPIVIKANDTSVASSPLTAALKVPYKEKTILVDISDQHLMGMKIPHMTVRTEPVRVQFGVGGTSASTDIAMSRFVELLPLLAELAELENAVMRLAQELRKTQRRCNALSKIFMPDYRETINYIMGSLEERERESFVILKMIRDRLSQPPSENA